MGKIFNFFVAFGVLVDELREFIEEIKLLNESLQRLETDIKMLTETSRESVRLRKLI